MNAESFNRRGARPGRQSSARGFTMIEIAICLGIIAISLVAIIGILPTGLRVQQDNMRDSLLAQDGMLLLDAMRSGRGVGDPRDPAKTRALDWPNSLDQLTNYVVAVGITNALDGGALIFINPHLYVGPMNLTKFPLFGRIQPDWGRVELRPTLTNGLHIVGLLSRPKWETRFNGTENVTVTNYIAALVRSVSGTASERGRTLMDIDFTWGNSAFTYVASSEVVPLDNFNNQVPDWTRFDEPGLPPEEVLARKSRWLTAANQFANFREVRLTLSGPVTQARRNNVRRWESPGAPARVLRTVVAGKQFSYMVEDDPQFIVSYFLPGSFVRVVP